MHTYTYLPARSRVLEQGIDINEKDEEHTAPLITASKLCFNEILEVLLARDADLNIVDKRGVESEAENAI